MEDQGSDDEVVRVLHIALFNDVFLNVKHFEDHFSGLIGEDGLRFFKKSSRNVSISV